MVVRGVVSVPNAEGYVLGDVMASKKGGRVVSGVVWWWGWWLASHAEGYVIKV